MNQTIKEHTFPSGYTVQLVQGDITEERVEAIVNAANAYLAHGAGVAGAIARKGGQQVQLESRQWVEKHGPVSHAEPAYTRAGDLGCKYIIHAVGPRWGEGDEESKLKAAVDGALKRAEELKLTSISFPAISTGIFGFPPDLAAQAILKSILDYLESETSSPVKLIRIVLYDGETLQAFIEQWEENDQLGA